MCLGENLERKRKRICQEKVLNIRVYFFFIFFFNLIGVWGYLYWKSDFSALAPSFSGHLVSADLEGLDEGLPGLGLSWSWCP